MSHEGNDKIKEQLFSDSSSMTTAELIDYCDKNKINIDTLVCNFDNTLIEIVSNHKWENYPEGGN